MNEIKIHVTPWTFWKVNNPFYRNACGYTQNMQNGLHSSKVTYVCHMTISSLLNLICCYNQLLYSVSVTVLTSVIYEIAQLEFEVTVVRLLDFVICYILMQCCDSPVMIHLETSWLTHAECLLIWHITACLTRYNAYVYIMGISSHPLLQYFLVLNWIILVGFILFGVTVAVHTQQCSVPYNKVTIGT